MTCFQGSFTFHGSRTQWHRTAIIVIIWVTVSPCTGIEIGLMACQTSILPVACPNTPTLEISMKTNSLLRNSITVCSRGAKDITWWKMERYPSSVFQFKSERDWAGRRACSGSQPVPTRPSRVIFILTGVRNLRDVIINQSQHLLESSNLMWWFILCNTWIWIVTKSLNSVASWCNSGSIFQQNKAHRLLS